MNRTVKMSNGENTVKIVGTEYGVTYVTDRDNVYDFNKSMISIVRTYRAIGYEIVKG